MRCRTMMDDIGFIGVSLAVINAPFLYSFAARMVVLLFLRTPTCHCNQPHEKYTSWKNSPARLNAPRRLTCNPLDLSQRVSISIAPPLQILSL